MADENKDQSKSTVSGTEPSSTGQFRNDATQSTGSLLTGRSTSASTAGTATGSNSMYGGAAGTGSGTASMRESQKDSTADMAASARQYAGDMASRAKEKGRSMFEQQKESALGQVSSVAGAIRSTAHNLEGEGQGQTAHYVQMIADQLESIGGRLRTKDLDTLVRDAEGIARRSPGTFLIGSVAAGFLLARFLKSSSEQQYRRDWEEEDQRAISAGEAGPYVGAATGASVGADGTPATSPGATASGASATGVAGSNLGGRPL